jgi:hypothetical protein
VCDSYSQGAYFRTAKREPLSPILCLEGTEDLPLQRRDQPSLGGFEEEYHKGEPGHPADENNSKKSMELVRSFSTCKEIKSEVYTARINYLGLARALTQRLLRSFDKY